ncbi:MAG: hypothetical protein JSV19_05455 [Phycisphaerales bacterium]|nr:MAG: hypothetical protein JSV19_05455 [Phycisphaerales bacterium]
MYTSLINVALTLAVSVVAAGCTQAPWFPVQPVRSGEREIAFDMDGNGRDDYWQRLDENGQKTELRFDTTGDGQVDETVRPRDLAPDQCVHAVLVLDGVPFDVVDEMYRQGWFRLFPPPARVISVFPAMTDLALTRVFTDQACPGYEALYFDRRKNAPSGGTSVYLSGANAPWLTAMDYRCSLWLDAKSYLDPKGLWRHELNGIRRAIRSCNSQTVRAYSVSTAGLATRGGRDAIVEYLKDVDNLCEQMTYERRGQIRFTLLADHGHDLKPATQIDLRQRLESGGYRVSRQLNDHRDVCVPRYGLVSCAVLHTRDPQGVAEALLSEPAADLIMYPVSAEPSGGVIMVRSGRQIAHIRRTRDGFIYEASEGDPLRLAPILERLRASGRIAPDGSVSDRDWLTATADHIYPDPLWRIWLAFNGLVHNSADVIVSLREGSFCGSGFFAAMVDVASTHGALTHRGSTTFALSNHTSLPPLLRVQDLGRYVRHDLPAK